jgi:hypothetical protein
MSFKNTKSCSCFLEMPLCRRIRLEVGSVGGDIAGALSHKMRSQYMPELKIAFKTGHAMTLVLFNLINFCFGVLILHRKTNIITIL